MIRATVCAEGVVMDYDYLARRMGTSLNRLLQKLTLKFIPAIGPPQVSKLFLVGKRDGAKIIIMPRTCIDFLLSAGVVVAGDVDVRFARPCVTQYAPKPFYARLFPGQQLIVDEIISKYLTLDNVAAGRGCCLLDLRAGMGKTWVAAALIARLGLRVLYVAPRRPLATQAVKDIRGCLVSDEVEGEAGAAPVISLYMGAEKYEDHAADNVTVIVINSALIAPAGFIESYDMMIIDEVHMHCSAERKKIFRNLPRVVLGMSATTENRPDGMDPITHRELAFAPGGVSGNSAAILRAEMIEGFTYDNVHFNADVHLVKYSGPAEFTRVLHHEATGKMFMPYMHAQFLRDPARMELAIMYLRRLYEWRGPANETHTIFVFCEYRDPLKIVQEQLAAALGGDVWAPELLVNDVGEFIGGTDDAEVQRIKDHARVILTTYAYSGTGVSIDRATAILFMTSRRANMQQIIPRILRRGGDQTIRRQIVDIIDQATPVRRQLTDRRLAYGFYEMEMTEIKYRSTNGRLVALK